MRPCAETLDPALTDPKPPILNSQPPILGPRNPQDLNFCDPNSQTSTLSPTDPHALNLCNLNPQALNVCILNPLNPLNLGGARREGALACTRSRHPYGRFRDR